MASACPSSDSDMGSRGLVSIDLAIKRGTPVEIGDFDQASPAQASRADGLELGSRAWEGIEEEG